ncbi:MAG: hypothetical protein ACXQTP_01320 [Candidatus Methanofastidiosia archaeon]
MLKKIVLVFSILGAVTTIAFVNPIVMANILWGVMFVAVMGSIFTIARTNVNHYTTQTWVPKQKATMIEQGIVKDIRGNPVGILAQSE